MLNACKKDERIRLIWQQQWYSVKEGPCQWRFPGAPCPTSKIKR